jgi:hypothetical protein
MDWLTKICKTVYHYSVGSGIDGYSVVTSIAAERAQRLYYSRQERAYNNLRMVTK